MIKVVLFCGHYEPHLGGVERYVKSVAKRLQQDSNFEVKVISNNTEKVKYKEVIDKVSVYRLDCLRIFNVQFPITKLNYRNIRVLYDIKKWKPDIVITNTRYFLINVAARLLPGKRVHIEHGSSFVKFSNPLLSTISKKYDQWFGGYILRSAEIIAGVSLEVNRFIRDNFKIVPKFIFYNSVDGDPQEIVSVIKNQNGRLANMVIFGYAGRLIPEKGIHIILDALEILNKRVDQNEFGIYIAGKGHLSKLVKEKAKKILNLTYLGPIRPEDMYKFYDSIDVFLLPTYYPEGFPTVLLEAGIRKKVIISTSRGSAQEIILDERFGYLIPEKDAKYLSNVMAECIHNIDGMVDKGQKVSEHIKKNFTWERSVNIMKEALINLHNK